MENITRSVYGSNLQTALLLNLPVTIPANSTLNEKLTIEATSFITATDRPAMKYATIGNGGHRLVVGPNNIGVPEPIQHNPTDASLFNHLPFVLRAVSNDLVSNERAKYGLRRIETHDGTPYIAYYLKRLNYAGVTTKLDYKTVLEGQTTTTDFIPNNSNLFPQPPALSNTGINVTTGNYVAASASIPFNMSPSEVQELLNVANIIYGDDNYAIISEIALCSGVDKLITINAGSGGAFNFNEVIATQIVSFISSFFAMKFNNSGIDILLSVGATEPMFLLTPA